MTTKTYTSVMDNTTDAGFQAWITELYNNLISAGMIDNNDTGSLTLATAVRPAINTAAGFRMLKFPDSSLFFKIEFGSAGATTTGNAWVTIGEGSNGSGTLTGQTSTRNTWFRGNPASSTTTTFTTYICVTNDYFGILFKANGFSTTTRMKSLGALCVMKTVDATGTATTLGYVVARMSTSTTVPWSYQAVRRSATAATYVESTAAAIVPGISSTSPTNSLDASGNIQAYTNWAYFPTVLPLLHVCTIRDSDVTELNTFVTTMVGSTSHTYLFLGAQAQYGEATAQTTTGFTHSLAMLYE